MITNTQIVVFMLVLTRVSAFVAFFPLFSRRQLPNLVKFGLAGSLSVFWFSELMSSDELTSRFGDLGEIGQWTSLLIVLKEVTIGLTLSFALGMFFWPAKVAGAYVGQEFGLSLASISDPGSQDSSTLVTRLFETFVTLMFFGLNLHHFLILVLHASFNQLFIRVGVLELPTQELVRTLNNAGDYGLLLAAPLLILMMLVTLVLAFLNRAAPALNLFSIGMPLRVGLGIFCLLLFCPTIFGAMQAYLFRVQEDIEELVKLMA